MATAMPRMASTTSMREEDKCVLVCIMDCDICKGLELFGGLRWVLLIPTEICF